MAKDTDAAGNVGSSAPTVFTLNTTTGPTVTSVVANPATVTRALGQTVSLIVNFSAPVIVSGNTSNLVGYLAGVVVPKAPLHYYFAMKAYLSTGGYVYVAGTLTGEGVERRYSTVQITCYKDRGVCVTNSIAGINEVDCQLSRLDSPVELTVKKWDDEVLAEAETGLCLKTTVSVDLKTEQALWVEEPINLYSASCAHANTRTYRWTIESPDWQHPQPKGRWD